MQKALFNRLCLIGLTMVIVLALVPIPVKATDVTVTTTFYSTTADGYIDGHHPDYATAWSQVSGTPYSGLTSLVGGQWQNSGQYGIDRAFLFFDTRGIPPGATINNASLSLLTAGVINSEGVNDYNITIQNGQPTYPHNPIVASDYYYGWYGGAGGTNNISSAVVGNRWNINLTNTGLGWLNAGGTTKLILRSSEDISGTTPGSAVSKYYTFYSRESGEAQAPQLIVTYTVSSTLPSPSPTSGVTIGPTATVEPPSGPTRYIIHGPYYEGGTVADVNVTAYLYQPYAATLSYQFNGSGGIETLWNLSLAQPALYLTWNITTSYNYTRIYYFTSDLFDEIWLFIPNAGSVIQQYSINTILLGQVTNAYTETTTVVNGTTRIIERQPSDAINALPFWLAMYHQYSLSIVTNQGTWIYNLPADNIGTKTYTVTADMVTQTETLTQITASATRVNGTTIQVYYYDPDSSTITVATDIVHYEIGTGYVSDYSRTDIGNTQSFYMTNATATTEYIVNITATRSTGNLNWQLTAPVPEASAQYWGTTFDIFGEWPIPSYQLPAMFFALLFFGIGSWRDSEALCFIAIAILGILQIIGWGYFPAPGIAFATLVVIFAYMNRGKIEGVILEG